MNSIVTENLDLIKTIWYLKVFFLSESRELIFMSSDIHKHECDREVIEKFISFAQRSCLKLSMFFFSSRKCMLIYAKAT